MEKHCANCGFELKEEANFCSNCGKVINKLSNNKKFQKDSNNNIFDIISFISIGFSILLFIFTIFLVSRRYIHSDDPECLICGLSVICNFLIFPTFIILLIISILHLRNKKNKLSLISLILFIISFIIYQVINYSLFDLFQ